MSFLLDAKDIRKSYGPVPILKGVDVTISPGETLALIGPNGAGKTTLFRVLTGEVPTNSGTIRYDGADITGMPAHERVRRGMGRTFQVARIFLEFTALENAIVAVEQRRANAGQRVAQRFFAARADDDVHADALRWLGEVDLADRAEVEAKHLSHGDKKRLELACTLALEPRILMLDEPTAGMARSDRQETIRLLARIKAERHLTMMMTEHDMDVVFGLADRVMVMNYGEIIAAGEPKAVREDPLVKRVYLGQEGADA